MLPLAGDDLYKDNALDRGHLTRRSDFTWGDDGAAAGAAVNTFTNTCPMFAQFNQKAWVVLEDYCATRFLPGAKRVLAE